MSSGATRPRTLKIILVSREGTSQTFEVAHILDDFIASVGFSPDEEPNLEALTATVLPHLDSVSREVYATLSFHPATRAVSPLAPDVNAGPPVRLTARLLQLSAQTN